MGAGLVAPRIGDHRIMRRERPRFQSSEALFWRSKYLHHAPWALRTHRACLLALQMPVVAAQVKERDGVVSLELSGQLNKILLRFRRGPPSQATAMLQTDSEPARQIGNAWRLTRCRWTLKVLQTAACVSRKRCADSRLLSACIFRSRLRTLRSGFPERLLLRNRSGRCRTTRTGRASASILVGP